MKYEKRRLCAVTVRILLILVLAALANGCGIFGPPEFPGGIRMAAFEALVVAPTSRFPVTGAADSGQMLVQFPGGTGSQTFFLGSTNLFGIDDHPNAITNASWQLTLDIGVVIPPCPPATRIRDVPVQGLIQEITCLL